MKSAFVVAMESEADALVRQLAGMSRSEECGRTVYRGELRGEETAVVVCGIGKVNAAAGTQYAIDRFAPERIFNLGVAGGIDPSMSVAEVFVVTRCFQCDFDLSLINHTPKGTVNEYDTPFFDLEAPPADLESATGGLRRAIVSTGDFFANDDSDRGFVYGEMGAWLRDMELGAIAHVCRRAGVSCCSIKSVSDVNYPNCPPPTEQYAANLKRAVDALAAIFR